MDDHFGCGKCDPWRESISKAVVRPVHALNCDLAGIHQVI